MKYEPGYNGQSDQLQ